jgi:hypothetical protein
MSKAKKSTPMTAKAVSRIQSSEAKQNVGQVSKEGFTARAQRTVANKK